MIPIQCSFEASESMRFLIILSEEAKRISSTANGQIAFCHTTKRNVSLPLLMGRYNPNAR